MKSTQWVEEIKNVAADYAINNNLEDEDAAYYMTLIDRAITLARAETLEIARKECYDKHNEKMY